MRTVNGIAKLLFPGGVYAGSDFFFIVSNNLDWYCVYAYYI